MVDKITWEKVQNEERLWTNGQGCGQEWYQFAKTTEFKKLLKEDKSSSGERNVLGR